MEEATHIHSHAWKHTHTPLTPLSSLLLYMGHFIHITFCDSIRLSGYPLNYNEKMVPLQTIKSETDYEIKYPTVISAID